MVKLTDKTAYSIELYENDKCILGFSNQFVVIDPLNEKKNRYEFVFPPLKHSNNLFLSSDKTKALILNTDGSKCLLYDIIENKIVSKSIHYEDEFYFQFFAAYEDFFYFIGERKLVKRLDIHTQKIESSEFEEDCSYIYDAGEKIFFFFLDEKGSDPVLDKMTFRCFSKSTGNFENWSFPLKGWVYDCRKLDENLYFVEVYEAKGEGAELNIYLVDLDRGSFKFWFHTRQYKAIEDDGFYMTLQISRENNRLYILNTDDLKVVDFKTGQVLNIIKLDCCTYNTIKVVSDMLIISLENGTFKYNLSELEKLKKI